MRDPWHARVSLHVIGERGNCSTVDDLADRLPRRAQRRVGFGEPAPTDANTGEEYEEPNVMNGRDLVAEEALSRGEFVLGLDEGSFGSQHRTEGCRRVGP